MDEKIQYRYIIAYKNPYIQIMDKKNWMLIHELVTRVLKYIVLRKIELMEN